MNPLLYLLGTTVSLTAALGIGTAIVESKENKGDRGTNKSSSRNNNHTRANSVAAMATNKNMEDKERAKRLMETLKQLEG